MSGVFIPVVTANEKQSPHDDGPNSLNRGETDVRAA